MQGSANDPVTADAPRAVSTERGLAWWTEAWALFMKNPGLWIVMGLVVLVIIVVLAFVPVVGGLVTCLIFPPLLAGWLIAAGKVEGGGTLEVADLFAAFKGDKLTPLVIVGALFLAAVVAISIVMMVLGFGGALGAVVGGASQSAGGVLAGLGIGMLALLAGLALGVLVGMVLWFAPALVLLRGAAPIDAVRLSFEASLRNIVPFLVWALIYFAAAIVASIPFGLGWVVLFPLTMLTAWTTYTDVFGR